MRSRRDELHDLAESIPERLLPEAVRALARLAEGESPGTPMPLIDHTAAWVSNLERARDFYERWFQAKAGPLYSSASRPFRSCFLTLAGRTRLELMWSPKEAARHAHVAVSVGSEAAVDRLFAKMQSAGVAVVSAPRRTGDGYYEAVMLDSEGNPVEITA